MDRINLFDHYNVPMISINGRWLARSSPIKRSNMGTTIFLSDVWNDFGKILARN